MRFARDEVRLMAANFAKLLELLRREEDVSCRPQARETVSAIKSNARQEGTAPRLGRSAVLSSLHMPSARRFPPPWI
jgi:hypothetical protein